MTGGIGDLPGHHGVARGAFTIRGAIATLVQMFLLITLPTTAGCAMPDTIKLSSLRFSPDNAELMFNYCDSRADGCRIGVYTFADRRLKLYQPRTGGYWFDGNYSPDGKTIVFIMNEPGQISIYRQVAVMNKDGTNIRKLTDSPNFKLHPRFSSDGKYIIYSRADDTRRTEKGDLFGGGRAYEIEASGSGEVPLMNEKFQKLHAAAYLTPDRSSFVFAADLPEFEHTRFAQFQEFLDSFLKKYGHNRIYIFHKGEKNISAPSIIGESSSSPSVARDGSIMAYLEKTNIRDGVEREQYNYDVFVRHGGVDTRLTSLHAYLEYLSISPDGTRIAFLMDRDRKKHKVLCVMNADGSGLEEISLPVVSGDLN